LPAANSAWARHLTVRPPASLQVSRYIQVRNWERFQHYRDREPPWIKNYTALLSDPNYGELSHAQRSTLHGLWLMYARSSRQCPDDTSWISRQLGVRVTRATLEALNRAGWIEFVLAPRYQAASARALAERHIEQELQEQDLRTYEEPLANSREEHDDEDLSKIAYEDLLRTITGVVDEP
jgi:hypothetical protein